MYERAKMYMCYIVFMLTMTPIYLRIYGKESVKISLACIAATFVGLAIPLAMARFRLIATELMLISNVVCRGLALMFVLKYSTG